MNSKLLKLAKMVMKFAELITDKCTFIYEGELEVGTELYVEVEGEFVPAEDGTYETETHIITVAEGKVESIEEKTPAEETIDEVVEEVVEEFEEEEVVEEVPVEDEKDLKIAELEAAIAERDAKITELESKIAELEDAAKAPVEESVSMNKVQNKTINKENKALKYFD